MFSSSVHELASSAVSKQLKVGKVESHMRHGDNVGPSPLGEFTRSLDKVNSLIFSVVYVFND